MVSPQQTGLGSGNVESGESTRNEQEPYRTGGISHSCHDPPQTDGHPAWRSHRSSHCRWICSSASPDLWVQQRLATTDPERPCHETVPIRWALSPVLPSHATTKLWSAPAHEQSWRLWPQQRQLLWLVIEMINNNQSSAFNVDQKKRNAAKYGTGKGFIAAWAPCILGFAVAGPLGAIGGALIGDKLARAIDLDDPNGKYTGEM